MASPYANPTPRHFNGEVHYTTKERGAPTARHIALGGVVGIALALGAGNISTIGNNLKAATAFNEENDRVSDIATELNGSPIRVDCDNPTLDGMKIHSETGRPLEVEGVVQPLNLIVTDVALPVVTLREQVCQEIIKFNPEKSKSRMANDEFNSYLHDSVDYAADISILLHEEEHTHQVFSESAATCYAFQKLPAALGKLGLTSDIAQFAAHNAAYNVAPVLEPSYLSTECKPNGALDLHVSDVYIRPTQ